MQCTSAAFVTLVVTSHPDSWWRSGPVASLMWRASLYFPWIPGTPLLVRVGTLAAWCALGAMLLAAQLERWTLKALLTNKKFLYEARSPSPFVRWWFLAVRYLTRKRGRPHMTYAFQRSLPRLPVPDLGHTVEGYLASARLLQSPEEYAITEAQARSFLANEGPRLNWYLKLKSWIAPNYVTDWWEKYVYLRGE